MEQQNKDQQQTQVQSQQNQIYITNYDEKITSKVIEDFFSQFGEIKERKFNPKFTFITYDKSEDALKAIEKANGKSFVSDKKLLVSLSKNPKDSPLEANLFVQNLNTITTQAGLNEYFSKFGKVNSVKISYNLYDQSNCYGYVQFEQSEDAQKVLAQNSHIIDGNEVLIQQFKQKNQRDQQESHTVCLNLKNSKQFANTNEMTNAIQKIFGEYGKVQNINVVQNGCVFIRYDNEESVKKSIESLHGKDIFNFGTGVSVYNPNSTSTKNTDNQLIASQIQVCMTEQQVLEAFKNFQITEVQLNQKIDKNYKQAILTFPSKVEATNALCNGYKNPEIRALFDKKTPLLNIYLDSTNLKKYKQFSEQKKQLRMSKDNQYSTSQYVMNIGQEFQFGQRPIFQAPQNFIQQQRGRYPRTNQYQNQNHHNNNYNKNQQYQNPKAYNRNKSNHGHHNNPNSERDNLIQRLESVYHTNPQPGQDASHYKNEVWRELGSRAYPKVMERIGGGEQNKEKVSKITGMIVDLETHDIKSIASALYNKNLLNTQIDEALKVYEESLLQ